MKDNTKGEEWASDIWSRKQVAQELGADVRTIDNWRKCQGLPFYKIGHKVVFSKSAVRRYLKSRLCRG